MCVDIFSNKEVPMLKKKSNLPRLTIILSVLLLLLLATYIPSLQTLMLGALSEVLESIPFAGVAIDLLGAINEGVSLNAVEISVIDTVWNDILKSLAIIVIFILIEKLINSTFKHEIDKVLALFASYFICSTVVSILLDTYISDLFNTNIPTAIIVLISLILFFAISAVLICWIYNKNLTSSVFYVIFKVLFGILSIAFTSIFSVIIYGVIISKKPLLLILAAFVVLAFCVAKFVERLIYGKRSA